VEAGSLQAELQADWILVGLVRAGSPLAGCSGLAGFDRLLGSALAGRLLTAGVEAAGLSQGDLIQVDYRLFRIFPKH
jgi:hypothetical protein